MSEIHRRAKLVKIGEEFGVVIDADVMDRIGITPETPLDVEVIGGKIVATPARPQAAPPSASPSPTK